jgi:linoleate 10R-lipoxygenase
MRFVRAFVDHLTATNDHNDHVIHALARELKHDGNTGERARRRIAASVFAEYVPTAPLFSKALTHVVDFYLDDARKAEREHIVAHGAGPALLPYIYEALRLAPPMSVAHVTARESTIFEGVQVAAQQSVLASFVDAALDVRFLPDCNICDLLLSFSCSLRSSITLRR